MYLSTLSFIIFVYHYLSLFYLLQSPSHKFVFKLKLKTLNNKIPQKCLYIIFFCFRKCKTDANFLIIVEIIFFIVNHILMDELQTQPHIHHSHFFFRLTILCAV